MIEQLEQDLEEIKKQVVKIIQCDILRGIDVTKELDQKLDVFKQAIEHESEN